MNREEKVQKLIEKTLKHIEKYKEDKTNREKLEQFNRYSLVRAFIVLALEDYCNKGNAFLETYPNGRYILDEVDIDILLNDETDVLDRVLLYILDKDDYNTLHYIGNSINDYFIREQIGAIEKCIWEQRYKNDSKTVN